MKVEFFVDSPDDLYFPPCGTLVHSITGETSLEECIDIAELVKSNRFDMIDDADAPRTVWRYRNYNGEEWKKSICKAVAA